MKKILAIIGILVLLLAGTVSATSTYVSVYPPAHNGTYVNATTSLNISPNIWYPWFATNPAINVTGAGTNQSWIANYTNVSQKFVIDLGSQYRIDRLYFENFHTTGNNNTRGVQLFNFYGSNSSAAFANLSYTNMTGWVNIPPSNYTIGQHVPSDVADPKYITISNPNNTYRYYAFAFVNNWGDPQWMGIRRIELQRAVTWEYTTPGTYTWTCPDNVTYVSAIIIGAGSSGQGGSASVGGGAGLNGDYEAYYNVSVTPGANYTVVVGTKGATAAANADGNAGSYSSAFGYVKNGGAIQTTRSSNAWGGNGEVGYRNSTKFASDGGGGYTGSYGGAGGNGYGAGGGGGGYGYSGTPGTGGAGADGYVIIAQYGYLGGNQPDFIATPTQGNAGTLVQFTDMSIITNSSGLMYQWNFGDGETANTTGSATHVYPYVGVYSPTLTLTNSGDANSSATITKTNYITILSTPPIAWYSPNQVRFTVNHWNGTNVPGATVYAKYEGSTLPDAASWLQSVYGIDQTIAAQMIANTTNMTGVTGGDGSVTFTMHSSLQYNLTVVAGSTQVSQLLYPKESDYVFWLPSPTVEILYEQVNATLDVSEPNTTHFRMNATYQDHAGSTSLLYFYVNSTNGTPMYSTSTAPGTALTTLSYTLPNVRGESYYYGLRATRTAKNISLDQGVTAKGPSGMLVDLRLPDTSYYPWICMFILFLVTALASKNNIRFLAILMPVLAVFFWWFGWLNAQYVAGIIPFACLLGVVYYMKGSLRENYGVGGSGSLLLNIVVFLIILQMMIGFVSELPVFQQTAVIQPQNEFSNLDQTAIQEDVQNFGGINDPIQSANAFASIGWATIKIALKMISAVFIVGFYLSEMFPYFPAEFFALIQVGIYCLYVFFILKLIGKSGTESDF